MSDESLIDDPSSSPDEIEQSLIPDESEEDLEIEDVTEEPDEEDYDFLAFAQGVRPTRRAVMLYQMNDVRAEYDLLKEKIELKRSAGEGTKEDEALLSEVAAELIGSGRKVVVESRSSDWMRQFRKDMKKKGVDPSKDKMSDEARAMMTEKWINELIAAHIVYPKTGISAEAIETLSQNNEQEVEKLHVAVRAADGERGVSPDFLRAPSGTPRRGSR